MKQLTITQRPNRWDEPFGPEMSNADVDKIMSMPPFADMDEAQFPKSIPLRSLLKNDCRINVYDDGDIIIREGDYGSSAFLILNGEISVALRSLPRELLGRTPSKKKNWFELVSQIWGNSPVPEARNYHEEIKDTDTTGARVDREGQTRIFLQDIPRILSPDEIACMGKGELFGEMAALTRSPRSATIFSNGRSELLEIRWQGLRDLMKNSPAIREYTAQQYRDHSLNSHLWETDLLDGLPEESIDAITKSIEFKSYGDFDWQNKFRTMSKKDVASQIDGEPIIAREGDYAEGLLLIRNGFARVSQRYGDGHRTFSYIGKGDVFGMKEILNNLSPNPPTQSPIPWQYSLRAMGYVDVLFIPTPVVEQYILPDLDPKVKAAYSTFHRTSSSSPTSSNAMSSEMDGDRIETLVQRRLINGEQAMLINLDRCTRCDDCVRACADAHDGNPRFIRQGPIVGNHMIAHACMHCTDPVCMIGCPTGAIAREHGSGVVNINDRTCIGCGTCAQSCPYDNIRMVEVFDREQRQLVDDNQLPIIKATKCDLCVDQSGGPACQNACPHDALVRLNMREVDVLSQWLAR